MNWTFPPAWDREHPAFALPRAVHLRTAQPLHAAAVGHARLLLWAGTSLIRLHPHEIGRGLPPEEVADRCGLGHQGTPSPVPFSERIALTGACAVLAGESGYLLVGLRHSGDVRLLVSGSPLAQVGEERWWAGWIAGPNGPEFWGGQTLLTGEELVVWRQDLPPDAAPVSPMVMRGGTVRWADSSGRLWNVDLFNRACSSSHLLPAGSRVRLWLEEGESDQVWGAWEVPGEVTTSLTALRADGPRRQVGVGPGPLRGTYAGPGVVVAVGESIATFGGAALERFHDTRRPPGRWIDSVGTGSAKEPRLLVLTEEPGFATLNSVRLSSGVEDLIWREPELSPTALLPVGDTLWISHRSGMVRLGSGKENG